MDFNGLNDDDLLPIFAKLPLEYRLTTVPLVCRRWAQLQPMVRKAVTSLTLISSSSSVRSDPELKSPFHLVDHQESIYAAPDLLQIRAYSERSAVTVERLQAELPNIRRLTVVRLGEYDSFSFNDELWSVMEHYAGQLTSFAFHYAFGSGKAREETVQAVRAALSADYQRLLSLINYQMPQLRHLLLNSDSPIFDCSRMLVYPEKMYFPLGSLYLPVLRRLHSFNFKSGDHEDVLLGSLRKFSSSDRSLENGGAERTHLKVRLGFPMSPQVRRLEYGGPKFESRFFTTMDGQLWEDDALLRRQLLLDYLFVGRIKTKTIIARLPAALASLQYLHLELTDGGNSLLALFNALSTSLPLLTRLYLNLGQVLMGNLKDDIPQLPALPSVTSLSLVWPFDDSAHFEAVLQPARVFPALRRLAIVGHRFTRCSSPVCRCKPSLMALCGVELKVVPSVVCIRQALAAPLKRYPPGAVRQILFNTDNGRMECTVEEL